MKFVTRQVEVEAIRYADDNIAKVGGLEAILEFGGGYIYVDDQVKGPPIAVLRTPFGIRVIDPGDWVIKDKIARALYVCKPDVFEIYYEKVGK